MNYVKVKILPTPHNVEFKRIGRLLFDINYADCSLFGLKRWFNSKEQYHHEDGPASIWNDGYQYWCRYGNYHRGDGPAVIWRGGREYWLNNSNYSEEKFNEEMGRRNELRKRKNLTETP